MTPGGVGASEGPLPPSDPTPVDPAHVTAMIEALGNTPEQIASRLHVLGFRGHRRSIRSCPLARYLLATVGQEIAVCIAACYPIAFPYDPGIDLPAPASLFVRLFDEGELGADLVEGA